MANIDLSKMLMEIIDIYGKNKGYTIPTISWSKENMLSRFGEYQFWENHIYISNMFQTGMVSENALKSVIFHEYTHQIHREHNSAFNERMKLFKGYKACLKEMEEYFNGIQDFPDAKKSDILIDADQELAFCKLSYNPEDIDSYWKNYLYCNHCITGILPTDIPAEFCKKPIKQIVWLVESFKTMYVVGWSKDVQLYSTMKKYDLTEVW